MKAACAAAVDLDGCPNHSATRGVWISGAAFLAWLIISALGCSKDTGFKIIESRFLGSAWNQGHADASIASQDGGFSFPVPGGSVWWFGDSFRGSRDESGKPHFSGGAVSCTVGMLDEADQHVPPLLHFLKGADGTIAQAIDALPGESWGRHRIWPTSGIYINGKAYTYYSLIELGKTSWDFKIVGSGLACSTKPLARYERIQTSDGWRYPVAPQAVLADGEWIYLYDVARKGDQQGIWLSRVRPRQIEDPNAYEFYCGPGPRFSSDRNKQRLFLGDVYGQTSVAWNEYLQKYVMVTSSNLSDPRKIWFRIADKPFGPWGKPVADITVPQFRQGKKVELVYCSYLHPELFREQGRTMNLTFSMILTNAEFDANNEVVEVEVMHPFGPQVSGRVDGQAIAPVPSTNSGPMTQSTSRPAPQSTAESQSATQPVADKAEIERLIKQLGSEKFAEREAAQLALVKIGVPAIPQLQAAKDSQDAERAERSRLTLKAIRIKSARFAIYLVSFPKAIGEAEKTDLAELELADEPLLTDEDVVAYDWDKHILKLTPKGIGHLPIAARGVVSVPFVVVANGQRCYLGDFLMPIASYIPKCAVIEVPPRGLQGDEVRIGIPRREAPDVRGHPAVRDAFKALGKLKDASSATRPVTQPGEQSATQKAASVGTNP